MEKKKEQQTVKLTEELLSEKKDKILSDKSTAEKKVSQLREAIRYHDWRYYVKSDPVISDSEYDKLYEMLRSVEEKFPDLATPDSPTQRVSSDVTGEFKAVKHLAPMLSLESVYDMDAVRDFLKTIDKKLSDGKPDLVVEPKFDGAGIALVYEEDKLVRGASRGDGEEGEDITPNVKTIRSIPLHANFSGSGLAKVEIRGEVLISKDNFKELNKESDEKLANPRNAASGTLRLKDPEKVAQRKLDFFAYHITVARDKDGNDIGEKILQQQSETIELLSSLGFKTCVDVMKTTKDIDELDSIYRDWIAKRSEYPFEVDGVVIKVNDLGKYDELGFTSHHPKWAVALKFQAQQATTTLTDVEFNVGRRGIITPVAKLKTVGIGGVNVSSASLHNEDFINERDIRIGDKVLVERAGDVIPYVVKPIKEARSGDEKKINFPKKCPSCGSEINRPKGESYWMCFNMNCPTQVMRRIGLFVSKSALDIDGMGESTIEQFYEEGILKSIPDVYDLDYEKIGELEGFGEKSVENLKKAVEESKDRPLHRLLTGLSIPNVGSVLARALAKKVDCLTEFADWSANDFAKIEDVGDVVGEHLHDFFSNKENIAIIEQLKDAGVKVCHDREEKKTRSKLDGMRFVFTGGLERWTRQEATELIEKLGGEATDSVSSKTTHLVVGEEPGSKLDEAKSQQGIKIIDESEFVKLTGEE